MDLATASRRILDVARLGIVSPTPSQFEAALEGFGIIASIGGKPMLKTMSEFSNSHELGHLSTEIEQRDNVILTKFNEFRNFDSVLKGFLTDVIIPVEIMVTLMCDHIQLSTKEEEEVFLRECDRNPPYHMLLSIVDKLKYCETSPLYQAMDGDALKSTKTVEAWKIKCSHLIDNLSYMQAYMDALRNTAADKKLQIRKEIKLARTSALDYMDRTIMHFAETFWPKAVEAVVEDTIQKNLKLNKETMEVVLKEKLNQINTTNHFYIAVNDDAKNYQEQYHTANPADNVQVKLGRWNIDVYRCKEGENLFKSNVKSMEPFMKGDHNDTTLLKMNSGSQDPHRTENRKYRTENRKRAGTVALPMKDNDMHISSTRIPSGQLGWSNTTQIISNSRTYFRKIILIVGCIVSAILIFAYNYDIVL